MSGREEPHGENPFGLMEELKGGLERALDDAIADDEEIILCINGDRGEALVATDRRVIILKAGYASGAIAGRKAKSYPYEQISSVETSRAIISGRLQISAAGTVEHGNMSMFHARKAENIANYTPDGGVHEQFTEAAQVIRDMIAEVRASNRYSHRWA